MDVSENNGTPKSSILKGFSIINFINHPFWGTPIFGNTHMVIWCSLRQLIILWYCWFRKLILHHLGCKELHKEWDIYHINWCRISAINSMNHGYSWIFSIFSTFRPSLLRWFHGFQTFELDSLRGRKQRPKPWWLNRWLGGFRSTENAVKAVKPMEFYITRA